ncbi:MAG: zf-HC2 domain-containing protein [Tissierellia bacterium]|nr:zf-HC2 domain-containing protein [Tissierellia bacterium]
MNISCDIILDLIPLVKDGVASEDSIKMVNEHIKSCQSCRAEYEAIKYTNIDQTSIRDEKIILAIKRSIFISQLIVLIAGAFIGIALSNSMNMFYNFLIMPIIGSISLIAFKKKWYLSPVAIFILTYLWQTIELIVEEGFEWNRLYAGLFYSVIYTILVIIGVVITKLLKYAFKRGE